MRRVLEEDEELVKGWKLADERIQGGADGGRIQECVDRRSSQTGIQSPARVTAHGGVDGG